jgi:hypothetical protein
MNTPREPVQIMWSLIWRATILAPILLILSVLFIASWIARFFLPVLILISAWVQDWGFVALYGGAWIISVALWRWNRFRSLWEDPPSLL